MQSSAQQATSLEAILADVAARNERSPFRFQLPKWEAEQEPQPKVPMIAPAIDDGEELWSGHVTAHRWDEDDGAFTIFAPFESARLKLTLLGGRPRLLMRVGVGIVINCWADQLGNVQAVGQDRLRLFTPSVNWERSTSGTARKLWLLTFHCHLQLLPQQRLAWAKVCQSRDYEDLVDLDIAAIVADEVESCTGRHINATKTFMRDPKQYATAARDRLLGRIMQLQHGTVQLCRSLSVQEKQRATAAAAVAKAAQQEADETAAQLAAVEAALAALGSQAGMVRTSSEVSAGLKQQTESASGGGSTSICDLWKRLFLVGTAWFNYEQVHQHPAWDFGSWLWEKQLPRLLEQRSAGLHWNKHCDRVADKRDHSAFVFATTEPQLIGHEVVEIPVLVFVIAPPEWIEAADMVALTSVQMQKLELLPLAELGMEWRPLGWQPSMRTVSYIHYLHSNLRWSAIREMGTKESKRFEYAIPYTPGGGDGSGAAAGESHTIADVRRVSLSFQPVDIGGVALHSCPPIDLIFDKDDGHRLRTFVPEFLQDEELEDTPQQRKALEDAIREAFQRARAAEADRVSQLTQIQDRLSDAAKNAVAEQFVVKAYPRVRDTGEAAPHVDADVISRYHTAFVNRFLGNADCVI